MSIEKLAIIGGGAWGTALAQVASTGGRETMLWAIEDEVVTAVNRIHENPLFLKGQKLNESIRATSNFSDGNRVITSQPSFVTTTSSSKRAADQPSEAGQ